MDEVWKPIEGFEGLYEVSNLGRVKCLPRYHSKEEHILKPTLHSKQKRYSVMLTHGKLRKRISVHRLVAIAFVDNPDPDRFKEVNHKDENPRNNIASNLEWCDRNYNMHYNNLYERISKPQRKGIIGTDLNGNEIKFESMSEADRNGYCKRVLSSIVNHPERRRKGTFYNGYYWRLENG